MVKLPGANATIQVNGGTGGSVNGSGKDSGEVLKKILEVLKKQHKSQDKESKLSLAGLGGLGKAGGLIGGLIAAIGGGKAALGSIRSPTEGLEDLKAGFINQLRDNAFGTDLSFKNIFFEDPETGQLTEGVAVIDEKTGQIAEILTKEEAQQKGILKSNGRVAESIETADKAWEKITAGLNKIEGDVVIAAVNNKDIMDASAAVAKNYIAINNVLIRELEQAKMRVASRGGDTSGINATQANISATNVIAASDLASKNAPTFTGNAPKLGGGFSPASGSGNRVNIPPAADFIYQNALNSESSQNKFMQNSFSERALDFLDLSKFFTDRLS